MTYFNRLDFVKLCGCSIPMGITQNLKLRDNDLIFHSLYQHPQISSPMPLKNKHGLNEIDKVTF